MARQGQGTWHGVRWDGKKIKKTIHGKSPA